MVGRPSIYSREIADRVCEAIIDGKTMREICSEDWAPSWTTISKWLQTDSEFATQYAMARDASADSFEAEVLTEARKSTPETAPSDRIRVDAFKWVAARRAPKKYGERIAQELSGPNGQPIATSLEISFVSPPADQVPEQT